MVFVAMIVVVVMMVFLAMVVVVVMMVVVAMMVMVLVSETTNSNFSQSRR